jgi:hypothetical protein
MDRRGVAILCIYFFPTRGFFSRQKKNLSHLKTIHVCLSEKREDACFWVSIDDKLAMIKKFLYQ